MYTYTAKDIRVIDGDTVECIVDLGFCITVKERFRLYGVDTPETRTADKEEKDKGTISKEYTKKFFLDNPVCKIEVLDKDKYGRWLAKFYANDDSCINSLLVENGLAKEYYGGKK